MKRYQTAVSVESNVAGNRRHGNIYPMFSTLTIPPTISDGENITETIIRRVTIEDGLFAMASKRIGYTGQHTDLTPTGRATVKYVTGGMIIDSDSPYIMVHGYSRNRYGGRSFVGRLNCETGRLERPIRRGDKTSWIEFTPSQYID